MGESVTVDRRASDSGSEAAHRTEPRGRVLAPLLWFYAAGLLAVLASDRFLSGDHGLAQLRPFLLPGPLLSVPAALMLPGLLWKRRWDLLGLWLACLGVIWGPIQGLAIPWGAWFDAPPPGSARTVRVLTLNRGVDSVDDERLLDLIEEESIDVLFFQESGASGWLEERLGAEGWSFVADGWVGSRFPLEELPRPPIARVLGELTTGGHVFPARATLPDGTTFGLVSVYTRSVRRGVEALAAGEFGRADAYLVFQRIEYEDMITRLFHKPWGGPLIVGGDLNMPAQNPLLNRLRTPFENAFGRAGLGYGGTWPAALPWVRIDHVWSSPHWSPRCCRVGPDLGSDHRPVIAELVLDPRP